MVTIILIFKHVLFLSLFFFNGLEQPGLLSVLPLTFLFYLLSHNVLKALASAEQGKEWGQASSCPMGIQKCGGPYPFLGVPTSGQGSRDHRRDQVSTQM